MLKNICTLQENATAGDGSTSRFKLPRTIELRIHAGSSISRNVTAPSGIVDRSIANRP